MGRVMRSRLHRTAHELVRSHASALAPIALWLAFGSCMACASTLPAAARAPSAPAPLPDGAARDAALDGLGRRLYAAVRRGSWDDVLFDRDALGALLLPASAARATRTARVVALSAGQRALWERGEYSGICVQQGRLEPAAGATGLRKPGFVFERALLIGREQGGGAIAGWVEGRFVNTDAGFGAVLVERVETPRRDHADLELQVCELRVLAPEHNHL